MAIHASLKEEKSGMADFSPLPSAPSANPAEAREKHTAAAVTRCLETYANFGILSSLLVTSEVRRIGFRHRFDIIVEIIRIVLGTPKTHSEIRFQSFGHGVQVPQIEIVL